MYHIGKIAFEIRKFTLNHFMKMYKVEQRYQHRFGETTFYLFTNNNNRAWLINVTKGLFYDKVGGFYQCGERMTYILPEFDFALIPSCMLPKVDRDFTGLNLQTMFIWMSSYPLMMMKYGFKPLIVYPPEVEAEYINVKKLLGDFL